MLWCGLGTTIKWNKCLQHLFSLILTVWMAVLLSDWYATQAQLEKLQSEIAQAAKKTGIASAAKLATIQPKKDIVSSCGSNLKLIHSKFVCHFVKIIWSIFCLLVKSGVAKSDSLNTEVWILYFILMLSTLKCLRRKWPEPNIVASVSSAVQWQTSTDTWMVDNWS